MYKLKSIAQRGMLVLAAVGLASGLVLPSAVFADALNPLTERSLLLSSSAPGYQNSDGSGNYEGSPNAIGQYYAPPGSGANGQKTGETFTFKVSTDSVAASKPVRAITLQYCTTAAGYCQAPGNNEGDASLRVRDLDDEEQLANDPSTWDTRVSDRESNATAWAANKKTSDLDVVYAGAVEGTDYDVYVGDMEDPTEGWSLAVSNVEDELHSGELTGKNNFITLTNTTGVTPVFNEQVRIVFKASSARYITNPGSGAFFVKINTYDSADTADHIPNVPQLENTHIIDGGVTVANVMTDSIHITTKVLETMAFSVGTENNDTKEISSPGTHVPCDPIVAANGNRLQLGNPDAEYSLEVGKTWDVYSYWRLSSNSSGGATVYYSGDTLRNTVGDSVAEIGATALVSRQGGEQFGLALLSDADVQAETSSSFDDIVLAQPARFKAPSVNPLIPEANYDSGSGFINGLAGDPENSGLSAAEFAFLSSSQQTPVVIAQNNNTVISCATAKVRYIGNIGADTPAGVYTTKINYLAAPQY